MPEPHVQPPAQRRTARSVTLRFAQPVGGNLSSATVTKSAAEGIEELPMLRELHGCAGNGIKSPGITPTTASFLGPTFKTVRASTRSYSGHRAGPKSRPFSLIFGLAETQRLKMLEIDCGIGRMTHRFSELFQDVIATDVSQEMIERARFRWGRLANVRFH